MRAPTKCDDTRVGIFQRAACIAACSYRPERRLALVSEDRRDRSVLARDDMASVARKMPTQACARSLRPIVDLPDAMNSNQRDVSLQPREEARRRILRPRARLSKVSSIESPPYFSVRSGAIKASRTIASADDRRRGR